MLAIYNVTVHGRSTTMQLSESDAKARGLTAADQVGAKKPANKARKPAAKAV